MASHPFHVLSLCSGVGGLELGLGLAVENARTVCYVEREAYAAEVLAARMSAGWLDEAPVWADLATFDGSAWCGVVDCIAAGFPCQPVSVAGARKAEADERWVWPDIVRVLRDVGPRYVFLENAAGLLIRGMGSVLGDLAGLGYDAEWGVFSAAGVGAPHLRRRVFVLAVADIVGLERAECPELAGPGDGRSGPNAAGPAGELADADRDGRKGSYLHLSQGGPHEAFSDVGGAGAMPFPFPPGPQDPAWERVVEGWPWLAPAVGDPDQPRAESQPPQGGPREAVGEPGAGSVEPAVCRVADGLPDRVDRLRALGNGVVPLVAAVAFRTLYERLSGR